MKRGVALALALVAVDEMAEIDPEPDWTAARRVLVEMLRGERQDAMVYSPAGNARTRCLWRAIEQEFKEPIRDIIQGMRDQGATWRTIAGALNVSEQTVRFWRKKLGLPINPHDRAWDDLSREDQKLNGGGGYGRWNGKR